MIDKSFSHLVSSVIQYRETCKICNFWGLNLSISVPFSPQLTRVEFRKYPPTRAIKTRRNKSNNCNAIYRNGEGEGRGKEVYGKIHSPGIRPYDLAISCRAINSICLPRYPLRTNHW